MNWIKEMVNKELSRPYSAKERLEVIKLFAEGRKKSNMARKSKSGDDLVCEWCPDDTCEKYWEVKVFDTKHIICNCCYTHLKECKEGDVLEDE